VAGWQQQKRKNTNNSDSSGIGIGDNMSADAAAANVGEEVDKTKEKEAETEKTPEDKTKEAVAEEDSKQEEDEEQEKDEDVPDQGDDEEDEDPLVIDEDKDEGKDKDGGENREENKGKDKGDDEEEEEEKEFEPTIDMMMNDFDDERTLEEEEALEEGGDTVENTAAEVAALQDEGDMPLEDLLKMYYGGNQEKDKGAAATENAKKEDDGADGDGEDNEDEDGEGSKEASRPKRREGKRPSLMQSDKKNEERKAEHEVSGMGQQSNKPTLMPKPGDKRSLEATSPSSDSPSKQRGSMSPPPPSKKSKSELARFYEATVEGRSLRSSAPLGPGGLPEEEEEESEPEDRDSSDHEGRDYSWKKTIMIGPLYQASVPSGMAEYDGDALPYENEDKQLWDPNLMKFVEVEGYLSKTQESLQQNSGGVASLPLGSHVRDDEQVMLYFLSS
jgi:hypothetical protein